jgi:hypothetical protein
LLGCSLALSLLILAAAGLLWWDEVSPVRGAENLLTESGPSGGTSREQVESWLDRQGIRHARYSSALDHGDYPAGASPFEFGGLANGVQGAYIVGKINAPHFYGWGSEVWVYFFFDSDGRLIQRIVKRWDAYL